MEDICIYMYVRVGKVLAKRILSLGDCLTFRFEGCSQPRG